MKHPRGGHFCQTLFWFFLVLCAVSHPACLKAEYPERPITIMVGMDPGGPVDACARVLVLAAQKYLSRPVIIENRGGGNGAVALGVVAAAKPDAYTLCAAQSSAIVDTALMQKVPFKPLKSFTPVTAYAVGTHSAILVRSDAPWKGFKEFTEFAKKNPGKIKYSTPGVGSPIHVAMEVVAHKDDIKWVHVPYKGSALAIAVLLGGHVDVCSAAVDWPSYMQPGTLRVLATHGERRQPNFPDVPTLTELGYDFVNWTVMAIVGPAVLPSDAVIKLETAFAKAIETPEFKQVLEKLYLTPLHYDSRQYDRYLKEKWVRTERVFKETGIIKEVATQPY